MKNLKIKKIKESKIIGAKFKRYIDFIILGCCLIIAFNIRSLPQTTNNTVNNNSVSTKMIYIFHDYGGNEYIMNDNIHGAADSWDYLFNDEIPDDLKGNQEKVSGSVSIGNLINESNGQSSHNNSDSNEDINNSNVDTGSNIDGSFKENISNSDINTGSKEDVNSDSVKDNQISIDDIMSDLGVDKSDTTDTIIYTDIDDSSLVVDPSDYESGDGIDNNSYYTIKEEVSPDNNSLIIEKISDDGNVQDSENEKTFVDKEDMDQNVGDSSIARAFTFIEEGRVLPTLVSWNDLFFGNSDQSLSYSQYSGHNYTGNNNGEKKSGITIIEDYADCMTPWGYKIKHGESVLAYQQMDRAPDICNIERRFCWKGKLSGTYTQQGCSVNNNYTYDQRGDIQTSPSSANGSSSTSSSKSEEFKGGSRQNADGTVTVKDSEIGGDFVFDRPNNIYTDFTGNNDNLRPEDEEVEMTSRPYPGCTTPRGEKVKHGQFVQAFKHKNGFSDIPCEAQFRLCTVGELMGTYTESSCKTRDTSFTDWVYGSPTWQTYSDEKLELIRKQIKSDERQYNKDRKKIGKLNNDDDFDELLYLLDENY